jgi:DNA-directed RNA polymerase subunit E'/Rpb7
MVGTCIIKFGYLITICKIDSIQDGVLHESGAPVLNVAFKALVPRPLMGEVLDESVLGIEKVVIEVQVGGVKAFIPYAKIPTELRFSEERGSFCSEEGQSQVLRKYSLVRFKVENVDVKGCQGATNLGVIRCISDDYLGMV